MKKKFNNRLVLFFLLVALAACKKMDSTFKPFIVPGGLTYTGKATSPVVFAGRNRVKIAWLRGADPSVTKAKVFWNNYADSVNVAIPATGDTISTIIENLMEKSYSFIIKTYDDKGNSSIPLELLGKSYGSRYQAQILTRPVTKSLIDANGAIIIEWGAANRAGGAIATEVSYTDVSGQAQKKRYSTAQASSKILDIKPGTTFSYSTVYLPDTLRSIDTFYTGSTEIKQFLFSKDTWSIQAFSSQHDASTANRVSNIIDGDPATRWHTLVNAASAYPHFVTIDMKGEKSITGFTIYRAKDDIRGVNTFKLSLSKDNVNWVDYGPYTFDPLTNNGQFYGITGLPKASYFRFTGLTGAEKYMVMGEIDVFGLK